MKPVPNAAPSGYSERSLSAKAGMSICVFVSKAILGEFLQEALGVNSLSPVLALLHFDIADRVGFGRDE